MRQKYQNLGHLQTAIYQARNKLLTNFRRLEPTTIQFAPNQMNKPGPFVEFYTGQAYSSGLAQSVHMEENIITF